MTAAFNLSQLANNLNGSGQLDGTDGLTGLINNSNLASSGTPSSTTFLRGDRVWSAAGLSAASTVEAQAWTSDTVAITPLKLAEALKGANQSLTSNGYQKLPGGLIVQWIVNTSSNAYRTVSWPIAFPTAILNAQVTTGPVPESNYWDGVIISYSTTQIRFGYYPNDTYNVIGIGY